VLADRGSLCQLQFSSKDAIPSVSHGEWATRGVFANDVVAQSGRYTPNATNLEDDFSMEGEQHYWVHVGID